MVGVPSLDNINDRGDESRSGAPCLFLTLSENGRVKLEIRFTYNRGLITTV